MRIPQRFAAAISPLVGLILLASCDPQGSYNPEQISQEVESMVAAHWAAIGEGDLDTVNSHHTGDFTIVLADVEVPFTQGTPEYDELSGTTASWQPREVHVQPLGADAAVASYLMDGSVTWPDGSVDDRTRRVTEVWVRQEGSWKEIHHHDSVFAPYRTAAVGDAIGAIWSEYESTLERDDLDGWLALWTEEGVQMPFDEPQVSGIDAIRTRNGAALEVVAFNDVDIKVEEVGLGGEWAFARGNYTMNLVSKQSGEPNPFDGKFMTIFQRQADGAWRIHRDIFNSNTPRD